MNFGVLAILLAAAACAGMAAASAPASPSEPAAFTPPTDEIAGRGFKIADGAPKARLARPIHAKIHREAADWEPLTLREGGIPGSLENAVSLKVLKVRGRLKGERTAAKAAARLHKGARDSRWLVIALHPKALERRRTHLEVRFRVFEGYVEEIKVAAVTVTDRRTLSARLYDSYDLRKEGVEYREEIPGSGDLTVAALDPRPGSASVNSGRLDNAEFGDPSLGFVSLSWSFKGVTPAGK